MKRKGRTGLTRRKPAGPRDFLPANSKTATRFFFCPALLFNYA